METGLSLKAQPKAWRSQGSVPSPPFYNVSGLIPVPRRWLVKIIMSANSLAFPGFMYDKQFLCMMNYLLGKILVLM